MIYEDENNTDKTPSIYIPEPNIASDEDSADSDSGGLADNLTGRQLSASAEIRWAEKNIKHRFSAMNCPDSFKKLWYNYAIIIILLEYSFNYRFLVTEIRQYATVHN
ncbi:hypothetical protein Zmor_006060 [Zophobas morio]|uniref:Uncharacterized protein n=1 Tax=Zophobas morio TaxID=2755281 RepID=A0AA38MN10_9CUCU|nr:hypothetical protein Zmor_006060 [Zophobas morio]